MINGKAIYTPKGAAGEYTKYACNFYVGCSNGCTYCFNKRFGWGSVPTLKKCFKGSPEYALQCFEKQLEANMPELRKHGVFFSFTTDPMLPETINRTLWAIEGCCLKDVPVKLLTKRVEFVDKIGEVNGRIVSFSDKFHLFKHNIAVGFTLTGHDDLEPNASTNAERIKAMKKLHKAGFKTWASIEPIIDFGSSLKMIDKVIFHCDLFKIGLESGKKYEPAIIQEFVSKVLFLMRLEQPNTKIYFKDSLLQQAGIRR